MASIERRGHTFPASEGFRGAATHTQVGTAWISFISRAKAINSKGTTEKQQQMINRNAVRLQLYGISTNAACSC